MKILCLILTLTHSLAFAQTDKDREWHEHCNMTIHTTVDGWELEGIEKEVVLKFPEGGLKCDYQYFIGFGDPGSSSASARVDQLLVMSSLSVDSLSFYQVVGGKVSKETMCKPIEELNAIAEKNNGLIKAKAFVKRVRQDWTTPKNKNVVLIESMTVHFENRAMMTAGKSIEIPGKYCSRRPE